MWCWCSRFRVRACAGCGSATWWSTLRPTHPGQLQRTLASPGYQRPARRLREAAGAGGVRRALRRWPTRTRGADARATGRARGQAARRTHCAHLQLWQQLPTPPPHKEHTQQHQCYAHVRHAAPRPARAQHPGHARQRRDRGDGRGAAATARLPAGATARAPLPAPGCPARALSAASTALV